MLKVPPGGSGKSYKFSITTPTGVTKSIGFSQQSTATPKVNIISSATISPNTPTNVILNRTVLPTTIPELVQIYSLTNPEYIYHVSNWSINSTQLNFSVTLNTGKYGFRLFDDVYGWYSFTTNTILSVSKSSSTYTLLTTRTSFNGGSLTITGDYIG